MNSDSPLANTESNSGAQSNKRATNPCGANQHNCK